MKKSSKTLAAAAFIVGVGLFNSANAAPVDVTIYQNWSESANGLAFSNQIDSGTLTSSPTGFQVNMDQFTPTPLLGMYDAEDVFGASFKGVLSVSATGTYLGNISSDDASYLFIDGVLAASNGGTHGVTTVNFSNLLTAGTHSFEVQYYNTLCCGANVGFELTSDGISVGGVPEPSTWAMMLLGFAGVGFMAYRRKSKPALMTT